MACNLTVCNVMVCNVIDCNVMLFFDILKNGKNIFFLKKIKFHSNTLKMKLNGLKLIAGITYG